MKALITGITGFVGSHLAEYILENHPDVEVAGLIRWRSPKDHIVGIEDPEPEKLQIGMALKVTFEDISDTIALPKFRPA